MRFEGVYVATVSLFDRQGDLSLEKQRAHLEFLADAGVQGYVPCATTGESPALSRAERLAQLQLAREVATQRGLTVIAGCGGNSTAQVFELVEEAQGLGCEAAMVVTPYYNKPTPGGLLAHYRSIADRSGIPILLYHVPGRTAVSMPVETVVELMAHPNIVGIKEASGQYAYWLALASSLNLAEKNLLAGDDDAFAPIAALGGRGIISASANLVPTVFVEMYGALKSGDFGAMFRLQKKVNPLVRALFAETNPAPLKYALHRLRGTENTLRLPLVPVSRNTETQIYQALQKLEVL